MLKVFYKVLRRIGYAWEVLSLKAFVTKHTSIYGSRIAIGKSFKKGKSFSFFFDASNSRVSLGNNVQFRDFCQVRSGKNSTLTIGNNVFFNNSCTVNCFGEITIGNDNQFGENVKFYDVNHNYKDKSKLISQQDYTYGKISIGNNCWIGANVSFLRNVVVGDNVVIGAGAVIYKSVPSDTIIINHQNLVEKSY